MRVARWPSAKCPVNVRSRAWSRRPGATTVDSNGGWPAVVRAPDSRARVGPARTVPGPDPNNAPETPTATGRGCRGTCPGRASWSRRPARSRRPGPAAGTGWRGIRSRGGCRPPVPARRADRRPASAVRRKQVEGQCADVIGLRVRGEPAAGTDELALPRLARVTSQRPADQSCSPPSVRSREVQTLTCQVTRSAEPSGGSLYGTRMLRSLVTRPVSQPLSARSR